MLRTLSLPVMAIFLMYVWNTRTGLHSFDFANFAQYASTTVAQVREQQLPRLSQLPFGQTNPQQQPALSLSSDVLPSRALTPGVLQTADTQTICTPGYASGVRPRGQEWADLKNAVYDRYGLPRGHRSVTGADGQTHAAYAIDHLVPLEAGGAPRDVRNLWPQPYAQSKAKDDVENALHELICDGRLTTIDAATRIARDWRTAVPSNLPLTADERSWVQRLHVQGQGE